MKCTSKLPLRWRITLMTGVVVFFSNLCMLLTSIHYANTGFDVVLSNVNDYYQNSINDFETVVVTNDEALEKGTDAQNEALREKEQEFYYFELQQNFDELNQSELTDADASSSSLYFPDNSSVSRNFNLISVAAMCLTTVMGMIVAYVLSARALRPICELNQSVLSITGSNLNRRVDESGVKDEVGSLQKSFNGMMDRLESSFNRQKEFSRHVAHELKTPLTTMKTGIQVLNLDKQPTQQEMYQVLKVTEKNIDRLISIVQDLFLFTNDQQVEFHDEIEVGLCLMNVLNELKEFASKQNVKLTMKCSQNIKVIQNEALLMRTFTNLIENAIKYNRNQGSVDIAVHQRKNTVCVEIKDTGIGIDKEHLERIWDPFYCVDPSRSRSLGGAGIGLALVRSISEKCGFDVKAVSEKGKGSCFTVEIPCKMGYNNTKQE